MPRHRKLKIFNFYHEKSLINFENPYYDLNWQKLKNQIFYVDGWRGILLKKSIIKNTTKNKNAPPPRAEFFHFPLKDIILKLKRLVWKFLVENSICIFRRTKFLGYLCQFKIIKMVIIRIFGFFIIFRALHNSNFCNLL